MAFPAIHHETQPINQITIDYTPEACTHCLESNSITLKFDHRGGARWRSTTRFLYGTFSSLIQCPKGNTSGLNFNIYLSSLEGDKSQDEIDFEFLGKDKSIVQTNYYASGTGNREEIHDLGFDCSDAFHEYVIKWCPNFIEWLIDGKLVRKVEKREGMGFPAKPMFLYASIWDASYIGEATWTGPYIGCDAPYRYIDKPYGGMEVEILLVYVSFLLVRQAISVCLFFSESFKIDFAILNFDRLRICWSYNMRSCFCGNLKEGCTYWPLSSAVIRKRACIDLFIHSPKGLCSVRSCGVLKVRLYSARYVVWTGSTEEQRHRNCWLRMKSANEGQWHNQNPQRGGFSEIIPAKVSVYKIIDNSSCKGVTLMLAMVPFFFYVGIASVP
ncbi:hypothetical protein SADUNF_Sadunf02G0128100 [Salix dunnii]|uniref:GH16 domain-containing protein n=1 Tax=Salix dunnii TaxID=1413687 RepID=A0A835N7W1_9ROSI|nr:hypothetical protein SADUNF_Sadunf02G0128100 [Salix dunnii]